MYNLKIIITSTRPGRKGDKIARWLYENSPKYSEFNTEIIDLAKVNLPFLDEPNHPVQRNYQHQHTKDWSAIIDSADAFIFVTPEYNFSFTAAFKNALDYLFHEWKYKPAGIVSYGGLSGGTRAVQMMKQVLTTVSVTPVAESVNIPFVAKLFDAEGNFSPTEDLNKSSDAMFKSLSKWTSALKTMR